MLASSTPWSHLRALSPRILYEFRIADERLSALSIFGTTPMATDAQASWLPQLRGSAKGELGNVRLLLTLANK